jgi:ferredoxin
MGLIIAGMDPVAVDSTACRVIGIDPLSIPMIKTGVRCRLGVADESSIDIVGESLGSVSVPGFRPTPKGFEPGHLLPIPPSLFSAFKNWIIRRPRFNHGACTRCGACVKICPAKPKALTIKDGRIVINDHDCILCYCCYEVCPSAAITLKRGFAASLLAMLLKI